MLFRVFLLCGFLSACDHSAHENTLISGITMGTTYSVEMTQHIHEFELNALEREVDNRLEEINDKFSTYQKDSEVNQLGKAPCCEWVDVSDEFFQLLIESVRLSKITNGYFDFTIGRLIHAWGFGPANKRQDVSSLAEIEKLDENYSFIKTDEARSRVKKLQDGFLLDFSAIAKGYAVDQITQILINNNISNFLIEIGGEIRAHGKNRNNFWLVAIEQPSRDVVGGSAGQVVKLHDCAIATSGDYKNFVRKGDHLYGHIINPKTKTPTTHKLASVSVISTTAAEADSLATALFAMGPKKGFEFAQQHSISAYFISRSETSFIDQYASDFEKYLN
ncbi:MAG: FAD:protein FMN transferase [Pseudomonadota bacterium]